MSISAFSIDYKFGPNFLPAFFDTEIFCYL